MPIRFRCRQKEYLVRKDTQFDGTALALAAERSDFFLGKSKEKGPEGCRSGREAAIGAEHVENLLLREGTTQPGDGLFIPTLEDPLDCVDGIRAGIEVFKVGIPEQRR